MVAASNTLDDFKIIALLVLGLIVALYLCSLPGAIARKRHHRNAQAIALLGWIGGLLTVGLLWIVALVWAYTDNIAPPSRPDKSMPPAPPEPRIQCPHCAEMIKPEAKVCMHCGRDIAATDAVDFSAFESVPRKWRITGVKPDGVRAIATVTADDENAARARAAKHFASIQRVDAIDAAQ